MEHYSRTVDFDAILQHKSIFLLGPRQTGKSTLLRSRLPQTPYIDLLSHERFRQLASRPESLGEMVQSEELVIIDEVQKLPVLLDEVQRLIDQQNKKFILTGSSARKLRRGNANLLAGRAIFFHLNPVTSFEVGYKNIPKLIERGGLPGIFNSEIHWEELQAYVGSYLHEEIQAESLTRSIENFSRFLDVAAHFNAEQINYTKIGSDAEVPPRTIMDYMKILEDTLLIHILPPYKSGTKRKVSSTEKIYFFDIGVANALAKRRTIPTGTTEFGKAFEQLVFLELNSANQYHRLERTLSFWRTRTNLEVDFVVDNSIAIEVKGTGNVIDQDLKSLRALAEEAPLNKQIVVCNEKSYRKTNDNIEIMPIEHFCRALWEEKLLET